MDILLLYNRDLKIAKAPPEGLALGTNFSRALRRIVRGVFQRVFQRKSESDQVWIKDGQRRQCSC